MNCYIILFFAIDDPSRQNVDDDFNVIAVSDKFRIQKFEAADMDLSVHEVIGSEVNLLCCKVG